MIFQKRFKAADLWLAVALGAAGFLLNMLELQLGWGLHFMFGNALVFAFLRVLPARSILLAGSISSLRSIFLWHHPWAWIIWTAESAVVARSTHKTSPVLADLIFWLSIGIPLLLLSYGLVMDMDRLSLLLVIAKQTTNGVLNVVVGEIVYMLLLTVKPPRRLASWPKMPLLSVVMMILLAIILIPMTVYLRIDAPAREQAARDSLDQVLQERSRIVDTTISTWAKSRSLDLRLFAEQQASRGAFRSDTLPAELDGEFSAIGIIAEDGQPLPGNPGNAVFANWARQALPAALLRRGSALDLAYLSPDHTDPQLLLIVPFAANARPLAIVARVRKGVLQRIIPPIDDEVPQSTYMVNSAGRVLPLSTSTPELLRKVQGIRPNVRASAQKSAILVSDISYGNAVMTDLRDARMVRVSTIQALPDWQILTIGALAPEVLKAREGQVRLFAALCGFAIVISVFGTLLSRRTERSLRNLAQSVAELAELGTKRDKIDSLVISELDDISGRIAFAGSSFSREHGALLNYQRRLNSIARHAPIMVYALDVADHQKGGLVYVSETIQPLLGYNRTEVAQAGWWSHAIHPNDIDRCLAIFSDLRPGKVVNAEYRLRHKDGHYVWVYDTLAVEANPISGRDEAVGVLIDISERKAAAEQLLQADKMASLGRMISGTAHELNQPLNFIKMAASNLREHARRGRVDADRFIPKLESIVAQVNRASEIILQMRIFGRTPEEAPVPIDVSDAVDAVLTMAAPQLELDRTRVETSECTKGVKVRALPVQLEQVLLNLILNANDAIRTRQGEGDSGEGVIKISVDQKDWQAIVTVEDNGTGLSAETLPKIFDPFFTTKPPKEGTGLGLPISYGIIRDLGGSIRAENGASGARFIIEMPATK